MTLTAQGKVTLHTSTYPLDADQRRDGRPRRRAAAGPRDPRPGRRDGRRRGGRRDGQATALQPRGPPAAAGRRRRAGQHRQGDARARRAATSCSSASPARRRSPTTASRSPARSSSPTSSRTWARSSSARSPTRPATSPATARRPRRCSPRPSCARACARSTRAPTRCSCGAASRRRPRCLVAELQRDRAARSRAATQLAHIATIAAKEDEVIGDAVADALDRVGAEGVVTIEESDVPGIGVEFVEGMHVENGWVSPYMVQRPRAHGDGLRGPLHPHDEQADLARPGPAARARPGHEGPAPARHPRREGRRLGARDARRQQPAPDAARPSPCARPASATGASTTSATSPPSPAAR